MFGGTLVVVQGTPFCNIDCSYCYLPDRASSQRMSNEVLSAIFRRAFESRRTIDPITFLWHAGEPLAAPLAMYEQAFELAVAENRPFGREFRFAIQTNGTLINRKWTDFVRRRDIRIGVSLDGPAFVHDFHRKDRSGRGTHARTMAGIAHLRSADIGFSAIAVVSDHSLDYPDEIFEFFEREDIVNVAFNAETTLGVHLNSTLHSFERMERFFIRFLQRISKSKSLFNIREISDAYRAIRNREGISNIHAGRNSTNAPYDVITVDRSGAFSTFCPELRSASAPRYSDFIMGNVMSDSFDAMEANAVFKQVNEEIRRGVDSCRTSCPYWFACYGGAPSSKFFETGRFDGTESGHCRHQKQAVVSALMKHIAVEGGLGLADGSNGFARNGHARNVV